MSSGDVVDDDFDESEDIDENWADDEWESKDKASDIWDEEDEDEEDEEDEEEYYEFDEYTYVVGDNKEEEEDDEQE